MLVTQQNRLPESCFSENISHLFDADRVSRSQIYYQTSSSFFSTWRGSLSHSFFSVVFSPRLLRQKIYRNATETPACAFGLLVRLFKCSVAMEKLLISVLVHIQDEN